MTRIGDRRTETGGRRSGLIEIRAARTGASARIRGWAKGRTKPFALRALYRGLGCAGDRDEERHISGMLKLFVRRGEILRVQSTQGKRRQQYRYNTDYATGDRRKCASLKKDRIIKAIYVSGRFTASDIRKLVKIPDKRTGMESTLADSHYIYTIIRGLAESGHIRQVGRRQDAGQRKPQREYAIISRSKFRVEVMG